MDKNHLLSFIICLFIAGCSANSEQKTEVESDAPSTTLEILGPDQTGIRFVNKLEESPELHYFNYQYVYHGGGVAVGDINNDGLPDIYFTSNQQPNKYIE